MISFSDPIEISKFTMEEANYLGNNVFACENKDPCSFDSFQRYRGIQEYSYFDTEQDLPSKSSTCEPKSLKNSQATSKQRSSDSTSVGSLPIKSRKGRKPCLVGLSKRNDIVLKSLLRKVRRFHWNQFKKTTGFTTKHKASVAAQRKHLKQYVELEFGMEPNQLFVDTLDSVLFMKEPRNKTNNMYHNLLYSYSSSKLQACMKNSYFKCLVLHYSFEVDPIKVDRDAREGLELILRS
ncbi:unnamed protein product [Moneuplotes crassus]|uniref:Uncharacterized protein n=1 Tax=Euplotes crassus TaxID=5936 RepID=A0AAD1U7J7_EUPCR|nr:unnamed protein product [Moneuplotes crassus]